MRLNPLKKKWKAFKSSVSKGKRRKLHWNKN